MIIFLDESGDLGWSFDKPRLKGGSSRFITIAGIAIENDKVKFLTRYAHELFLLYRTKRKVEIKGSDFSNYEALSVVQRSYSFASDLQFQVMSITADKRNVHLQLRRDSNVFYNHILNNLLAEYLNADHEINIVLDDRTVRAGSRNSF